MFLCIYSIYTQIHLLISYTKEDLEQRCLSYMEHEMPDVQARFKRGRGGRDHTANICWPTGRLKQSF